LKNIMKNIPEKNYPFDYFGFLIGGLGGFSPFSIGFGGGGGVLGGVLGVGLFCIVMPSFMLNLYQKMGTKTMKFKKHDNVFIIK
jgi:hypothetical protein